MVSEQRTGLGVRGCVAAAVVAAGADNLNFVGNPFAVGAAILVFGGRRTATGRICAFLGSSRRHIALLNAGDAPGIAGYDAGAWKRDAGQS